MNSETQQIEEQIAQGAASLMASIIRLARITGNGDSDIVRLLGNMQNCRVTIAAVGRMMQIEARANVDDAQYRIWGATFSEEAAH